MKNHRLHLCLCLFLLTLSTGARAQEDSYRATITLGANEAGDTINPLLYGQFIEHLGRCIDGGLYAEDSPLSDERGFRTDVLEKVKELAPLMLRFPGGTVTKIYHWEYGIGPKEDRPKRPNLIWGGNIEYHFGTAEFIAYCREIGAEPMLVVNLATGTPEEASNWVEYCNGTGDTYYANLRRQHGYEEPFNVVHWGLGNEEAAEPDAGRHQDPEFYAQDVWQFVKLMKLQDPSIKLTMAGEGRDIEWNRTILEELGPMTDYLSVHYYAVPSDTTYASFLYSVYQYDAFLDTARMVVDELPLRETEFPRWYRFAPRQGRVKVAVDEWGIWPMNSPKGRGTYNLEFPYNWGHALGTAAFLHMFQKNADIVEFATWAQTANVLAPIMTDESGSWKQTVFTPLAEYRRRTLPRAVDLSIELPGGQEGFKLDAVASTDPATGRMMVALINLDEGQEAEVNIAAMERGARRTVFTAPSVYAVSTKDRDVVRRSESTVRSSTVTLPPASITFLEW